MNDRARPLRLAVLGPLRVLRGGNEVPLGSIQQRIVLSVLVLHANRPVRRDQIIDEVWDGRAPAYAVNLLQKHMSGLRRALEPSARDSGRSVLRWTDDGYLLTLPTGGLDLEVFDREVVRGRAARATGDLKAAAEALRAALDLWRGTPFQGLTSPLLDAERDRLVERHVAVTEERIELDLARNEQTDLVPELRRLVAEHPLRERARGLLMLALHRSGGQAEALAAFHEARQYLRDELGVAPSASLQRLYQQILQADPAVTPATGAGWALPVVSGRALPLPAQLPHAIPDLAGRGPELERLDSLLSGSGARLAAIVGAAGVGKTALAIAWAHRVRERFPDGQLYVNLRGFDPNGSVMEPGEAIEAFLGAFGVASAQIPSTIDGRAALYRSVLVGRRVLVVLDNARDADQVRPLLPAAPGCVAVVTSRDRLTGLVASEGAALVDVGLLGDAAARQLLVRRLDPARVAADPDAVGNILTCCAGLPVALTIVAARAAAHPRFALAVLADQLCARRVSLDAFEVGDRRTSVRAVISWSYRALDPGAARMFRLVGIHPGPEITVAAAASLLGCVPSRASGFLSTLVRTHLVEETSPGRFTLHDLLRAFATEQAKVAEPEAERLAALHRTLYHYLYAAQNADRLISPYREPLAAVAPAPEVAMIDMPDEAAAREWLKAELPVLLAAVDHTVDTDPLAEELLWGIETFLDRRGYWRKRRYDNAHTRYRQTLQRLEQRGDRNGQARVHTHLAWVLERQGHYRRALGHARRALDLYQRSGERAGLAFALNAVGWCHAQLGQHEPALDNCRRALTLYREMGHWDGEAHTLDSLAHVQHGLGNHHDAVTCYQRVAALWRDLGVRSYEAEALASLGDVYRAMGDLGSARAAWEQALPILDDFGHPAAHAVRVKLTETAPELMASGARGPGG